MSPYIYIRPLVASVNPVYRYVFNKQMRAFSLIFDKFKAIFTNLIPYIIILISNTTTAVLLYRLSKKNLERLEIPTINLPRLIHHERPNISLSENWHSQSVSKPCASSKPCSSLNPKNTDRSVIMPIKSDSNSIYSQSKEISKNNPEFIVARLRLRFRRDKYKIQ
ncbi:unnamed protein product [Gordionus sp. m RMFG-2023]